MRKTWMVVALVGALAVLWAPSLFAQWSTDLLLSPDDDAFSKPSYSNLNNAWQVAASGDEVHVIWCDERFADWPPLNWTKKGLWKLRMGT